MQSQDAVATKNCSMSISITPTRNAPENVSLARKKAAEVWKQAGHHLEALTSGLDLKLKITFVLVQRSVGQTASSATYSPAALHNDHICACKTKTITRLVVKTHTNS